MTPSSVMILWADERSPNLGVRVLARGSEALVRRAWGDSVRVEFQDAGSRADIPGFGGRSVAHDLGRRSGPVKSRLRQFDVVLDTGAGDSFTDIYGVKRLAIIGYVGRNARKLGVNVMMGPQTIGPFESRVGKQIARRVLRYSSWVSSRDPLSTNCASELGRPVDMETTDVVFALDQPPQEEKRFDVLLNVSGLLWNQNSHVDHLGYRQTVTDAVRALREAGRGVTLLPHVLDNPFVDNDVAVLDSVSAVAGGIEVVVPNGLDDVRGLVAAANVVVGSRMHACLNALSVGTPAVPLAYSRKFKPLLDSLGWSHTLDLRSPESLDERLLDELQKAESLEGIARLGSLRSSAAMRIERTVDQLRARG